jgi:hypothetical protein
MHHTANGIGRPAPLSPSYRTLPHSSPLGPRCTSRTQHHPYYLETAWWQTCATPRPWRIVTVASPSSEGHSWNSSRGHVTQTLASHPFAPATFAGSSRPTNTTSLSHHKADSTWSVTGHPLIGNSRIIATSSRVTVISPHGRWKESPASTYPPSS